jgi:hypothetical protein
MKRVRTITCSMIVHTRNHSGAVLDSNVIDSRLTLVDLSWACDAILAVEHNRVLQLICFNNSAPDNWQPLTETCQGIVEKAVP